MTLLSIAILTLAQADPAPPPSLYPPPFGAAYSAFVNPNYDDYYWIDGPANLAPGQLYPLIVMFGGQGELHAPPWGQGAAAFMSAAKTWTPLPYIVVLHDGGLNVQGTPATYGCEEFHRATEAVIEEVASIWPVDRNRVYGYGRSMGGGECLAFAARHQDPTRPTMFAAVVDQSGTISMTRYYHAYSGTPAVLQLLYGAGPYGQSLADDFLYQRATALDLPFNGTYTAPLDFNLKWGFHLAHNLRWVSRTNFHVGPPNDGLWTMIEPIETFNTFLASTQVNAPDQVQLTPIGNLHQWDDMRPSKVLNYFNARTKTTTLDQFSRKSTPGLTTELMLFSEDHVRHHCFSIERVNPALFGRLHVKLYPGVSNGVVLWVGHDNAADNVAKTFIHVDPYLTQMTWNDPTKDVFVDAHGADLGTIDVLGADAPIHVHELSGGVWVERFSPGDWYHSNGTLSLYESTGLQRQWRIQYH